MKIIGDRIKDNRIDAYNLLIEISLGEYFQLSQNILSNNDYQRNRVKSSQSVYSLLKNDLKKGCVMPPLVLALSLDVENIEQKTDTEIIDIITRNEGKLLIIDGLQRSFTIKDLINENESNPDIENIKKHIMRFEIYIGINKLGILYRMLTLNTGQTTMSTRHQIEIIYADKIETGFAEGIKLIREVDNNTPTKLGEYKFRDIIEGFTSFMDRNYLTLDRIDILDNIKSLETLSIQDQQDDLFNDYLLAYHSIVNKINNLLVDWEYSSEGFNLTKAPFGKTVIGIFNKSQLMTGFGAAIGGLIDLAEDENSIQLNKIPGIIEHLDKESLEEGLNTMMTNLDDLAKTAKKVGNDQRLYFKFLFGALFDSERDSYLNLDLATKNAYKNYQRETYG